MATALDEIIAGREPGTHGQPAHHRYVVTVFGLYGRPCGRAVPVSAVVRLLSELGHEATSIRSSISRLKKKGVLVSERIDGQNGYSLAAELEPHMLVGDGRIFAPRAAGVGDPWLLASFSVPESERKNRHKIRAALARMGFGIVAPGLSIAPVRLQEEATAYMEDHGLDRYVEFFVGQPASAADLPDRVAKWWDLDELESQYEEFLLGFEPEAERWRGRRGNDEQTLREAFRIYVPMVTQWRRLPYLDPGLPAELLPPDWMGSQARRLFAELNKMLAPLSAQFAERVIRG